MGVVADTLQIDSTLLATWQADERFDYNRELVGGDENLLQWLWRMFTEWLNRQLGAAYDSDVVYYTLLVVGIMVAIAVALLVLWRRSSLFRRSEKVGDMDYELEDDTIYNVDFDTRLAEAERRADWRQAVRLLYLQTLKRLNDGGRIEFQLSKTPSQYARELGDEAFSRLSASFVRIRYGNFEATEALYQEMKVLQRQVSTGSETQRQVSTGSDAQKGGGAA